MQKANNLIGAVSLELRRFLYYLKKFTQITRQTNMTAEMYPFSRWKCSFPVAAAGRALTCLSLEGMRPIL